MGDSPSRGRVAAHLLKLSNGKIGCALSTGAELELFTAPLWRWSKLMTPDFVDGILSALIPSEFMVAWLLWRVT
jgi:hypothetical protein